MEQGIQPKYKKLIEVQIQIYPQTVLVFWLTRQRPDHAQVSSVLEKFGGIWCAAYSVGKVQWQNKLILFSASYFDYINSVLSS